ncbi:MAG: hypothetical protein KDB01_20180 [Planctomycetaceae bacterium]|nr:hypothetical protein [Planctomycetaceae bacterium]
MINPVTLKPAVSVSDMASQVNLSRQRFYQLIDKGIFPEPLRDNAGRPYYDRQQQLQCLQIRHDGVTPSGEVVLFNVKR